MSVATTVVWVCDQCGSDDVYREAWVNLNDPDLVNTYDQNFCGDCEGETSISQVIKEIKS